MIIIRSPMLSEEENERNYKPNIVSSYSDLDFWCLNATLSNISAISWQPFSEAEVK